MLKQFMLRRNLNLLRNQGTLSRTSFLVSNNKQFLVAYNNGIDRFPQSKSYLSTASLLRNNDTNNDDILKNIRNIPLNQIKIKDETVRGEQHKNESSKNSSFVENILSWPSFAVFFFVLGGSYYWASRKKRILEIEKEAESNRSYVGNNAFKLLDSNRETFTNEDLLGKFSLLYFGFSHCPDICPAELDKLSYWVKQLKKRDNKYDIQPVFVTCDPIRDSPEVLKEYLKDFNDDIIGLTGTHSEIKDMCENYKVFFSTPETADPNSDYIVDHSTFIYLIDPEGEFIEALGTIYDEKEGLERIQEHINAYIPKSEREKRMKKWYSFLFK